MNWCEKLIKKYLAGLIRQNWFNKLRLGSKKWTVTLTLFCRKAAAAEPGTDFRSQTWDPTTWVQQQNHVPGLMTCHQRSRSDELMNKDASKLYFNKSLSTDLSWQFLQFLIRLCSLSPHRGSILASHPAAPAAPAAPGSNPGTAEIFSLYCLVGGGQYWDWTYLVLSNGFHKCS